MFALALALPLTVETFSYENDETIEDVSEEKDLTTPKAGGRRSLSSSLGLPVGEMRLDSFFEDYFLPGQAIMSAFPPMPFLRNFDRDLHSILRSSSPAYELSEDDNQFQLTLDLPGITPEDCNVCVEQHGSVLRIWGGKKIGQDDGTYSEARFDQRFNLGKHLDTDHISVNLSEGVLVIKARKDQNYHKYHSIAITDAPHEQM